MTRITELISILDSEDEPLAKRLKLANSAFKSTTLPIHSKEIHLLKWLLDRAQFGDTAILQMVNDWLHSEEILNINKADVSQENIFDILKVINTIASSESSTNIEPTIVESFLHIINNKTFQQYFKHDLKLYFKLVCQLIECLKDTGQLMIILKSDVLFSRIYFAETKSYKYFYKICLPTLEQIMHSAETNVKRQIIRLVSKCLFHKNVKQIENYLKTTFGQHTSTEDFSTPNILINAICDYYNGRNLSAICLIYSSFCSVFESKFEVIYQFTVLLLQICGFDVKGKFKFIFDYDDCDYNINFSTDIINGIYDVLTTVKTSVDDNINGINFSMTTQLLLSTLMSISNPSKSIMKIITNAISAEPLILEPMLGSILPYIMLRNINENIEEYKVLLTHILNISAKLYRLSNLIAKMLPSIKNYPTKVDLKEGVFNFKGSVEKALLLECCSIELILPPQALGCFSKHILDLPSWQLINIFKTFIYHLKVVADDLSETSAGKLNYTYNEMLCTLFCTFLSSVRITEHTTPDIVVNKFIKCMLDLKDVLQVMGNRLLELNHNQYIMRAYLNICYTWGELLILIGFYSSASDVDSLRSNNNDYQVCCTSYIHSYLTAEQWCSIAERITNFGEKPCKNIMQSLQLQSIKAIFLFENRQDDIDILFLRNLTQNPSLESLLSDQFAVKVLIPRLQHNIVLSLAKEFIRQALYKENNGTLKCSVIESPELNQVIVLNVLIKIAKSSQCKEEEKVVNIKELLSTLVQMEAEHIAINAPSYYNSFRTCFSRQSVNEKKMENYLSLLQKMPLTSLGNNIQLIIFLYISALLQHLTDNDIYLKLQVENIIIGMIQFPSELLSNLQPKFIIPLILNNITDYKSVFLFWLENMQRTSSNFIQKFKSLINYLLQKFESDSKVRTCVICVLNNLNKNKKHKVYLEFKSEINELRDKVYKSAIKWLSSDQKNTKEIIYFYALSLRHCLSVNNHQNNDLKKDLAHYLKIALTDTSQFDNEASLLLFSTVLTHKKQLEVVDDELILNIWKTTQTLKVEKDLRKEYSHLVVLIYEHISNENFAVMCEDLNNLMKSSLTDKEDKDFTDIMIIINGILQCSLNPIKIKILQSKVEIMLAEVVNSLVESTNKQFREEVLAFEINIIQANHFMITASMMDEMFRTIFILFSKSPDQMEQVFKHCVQILNLLLKYRMPLITDRFPSFFQQYRILIMHLCKVSDSSLNLSTSAMEDLANCAHQLEKLTNVVVTCGRHVQRIVPYLVADILQQYEHFSIYSSIKIHIDNCVYGLLSLFDQHAVSFLMRSLSTASTELFKYMHNNYKRYYRFTGKV